MTRHDLAPALSGQDMGGRRECVAEEGFFMADDSASNARQQGVRWAGALCGSACLVILSSAAGWASPLPPFSAALIRPGLPHAVGRRPTLIPAQAPAAAPALRVADVSGPAGRPLPLNIETPAAVAQAGQLFIFSGLPKGVTLQPGGDFGEFWAVNADVVGEVTLTAPHGYSGSFTVWITRGGSEPAAARSASLTVTIGTPAITPTVAAATGSRADGAPAAKSGSRLPNEAMLLARANDSFTKGDVSGARVIYEYLAAQGSSAAAMAMGETFDPLVLARLVVKGLEADEKKARFWYEKAENLGSGEARGRLNALAAR